jgi:hypothetical protein
MRASGRSLAEASIRTYPNSFVDWTNTMHNPVKVLREAKRMDSGLSFSL